MELFYKDLFEYNHAMNQKLIEAFNKHSDKISENSVKWMNHVLNAHQVWNNRIDKQEESYSVWQIHSLGYLKEIDQKNFERSGVILKAGNFTQEINYVNSQGKAFKNSVKDILFHVINHSTYHRGQIASDFRQSGLAPEVTDYIFYKR